jgi:uncharacterized Ntn-hydrolase superfamily protein
MTMSIAARDSTTGELGVAVATCMPAVGAVVPWAQAGIGAVATQAIVERAYGPRCLDALAHGADAAAALASSRASDPLAVLRQVGVVGADGSAAAFTGELCIDAAGHRVGDGYAIQANMMAGDRVWPAMEAAFTRATGPLAHRLLTTLDAGQAEGGDARGCMSAALVVVDGAVAEVPGGGTVVDVRVDESDDPLGDLTRLVATAEGFALFDQAVEQLTSGDAGAALTTVDAALARRPGDRNMRFLRSGALVGTGSTDAGLAELQALLREHPPWEVVIRSFVEKGLIALPDGVDVDRLLGDSS